MYERPEVQANQIFSCFRYVEVVGKANNEMRTFSYLKILQLCVVPLLLLIGLGAWAVSSPVASSPDDDFHMVSIWCAADGVTSVCESSGKPTTRFVAPGLIESRCFVFLPKQSANCQTETGIFSSNTLVESDRGSFSSNYPPVYYSFMHLFAGDDIQLSVVLMRLVNVLIFVLLNCWLWFALPRKYHLTQILMWLVTLIPLGISIIASVNPSSWAITGVGISWLSLFAWLSNVDRSARSNWQLMSLFVISSVIAAGSRADAAIYVICGITTAIVLAADAKENTSIKRLMIPLIIVCLCVLFFILSGQSAVVNEGLPPESRSVSAPESFSEQLGLFLGNAIQLPSLILGIFGYWNLGWNDTEMPIFTWVASGGIFAGVVFMGLKGMYRRQTFVTVLLGALIYLIPLYVLQKSLVPVGTQVQPRYLLPLLLIFTGVVLLPRVSSSLKFSNFQIVTIIGGLFVAYSLALHFNIRRYVTGVDINSPNLNANIEWWWNLGPTPMFVWAAGSVSMLLLSIIFYRTFESSKRLIVSR